MVKMIIELPDDINKQIEFLKIEKDLPHKKAAVIFALREYIKNRKVMP